MSARNLTGQRFGILTVQRLNRKRTKDRRRQWDCKCDCGRSTTVPANSLLSCNTKSCGCLRTKKPADFAGKPFGLLVGVRLLPDRDKHGKTLWEWKCKCGRLVIASANQVTQGKKTSCGCANPLRNGKMKAEFKRLDERTIDRVLCYSRRRAAKYLGVDGTTLDSWKDYCALLGRALPTRLLPTVLNRKIDYFEKGALDEVLEAKTRLEDIPNVPRYIYIEDAMKALSCSLKTVRNKLRTAGMKARKELGKGKDGHPRRLTFIPRSLDPRLELRATPNNSTSTSNLGQKRGRGRQRGWRDEQAIERDRKMIAAWETGEYDSASELGREFRVDPSYARKLIRSITRAGK